VSSHTLNGEKEQSTRVGNQSQTERMDDKIKPRTDAASTSPAPNVEDALDLSINYNPVSARFLDGKQ